MKSPIDRRNRSLNTLLNDETGLSTVEYIIILVLIAIVGMAAWKTFGEKVRSKVSGSSDRVGELDPGSR